MPCETCLEMEHGNPRVDELDVSDGTWRQRTMLVETDVPFRVDQPPWLEVLRRGCQAHAAERRRPDRVALGGRRNRMRKATLREDQAFDHITRRRSTGMCSLSQASALTRRGRPSTRQSGGRSTHTRAELLFVWRIHRLPTRTGHSPNAGLTLLKPGYSQSM